MNIQPFDKPPQWWGPRMTPWWFHMVTPWRRRAVAKQGIRRIELQGLENLEKALRGGGVLLTPNHSFHWDSYCLVEAASRLGKPFYIMTAWQVFAGSGWFDRESMQRCGCFSVDREGTDMQAMKCAVEILQERPHPLVIFPEGDVYHSNDRVTTFRDGAAAIALMAARKSPRPVFCVPTAIKAQYLTDPTPSLERTAAALEARLFWRTRPDLPLPERIDRLGKGILALKEQEHFGRSHEGTLHERNQRLSACVLGKQEARYGVTKPAKLIPERVKELRRRIIAAGQQLLASQPSTNGNEASPSPAKEDLSAAARRRELSADMEELFFVIQLYSYPPDYVRSQPTWERMAETLDKLEEDVLQATYPSVRGDRRVVVRFGEPVELPPGKDQKFSPAELTERLQADVQTLLDGVPPLERTASRI